jgi:hypothetical protein
MNYGDDDKFLLLGRIFTLIGGLRFINNLRKFIIDSGLSIHEKQKTSEDTKFLRKELINLYKNCFSNKLDLDKYKNLLENTSFLIKCIPVIDSFELTYKNTLDEVLQKVREKFTPANLIIEIQQINNDLNKLWKPLEIYQQKYLREIKIIQKVPKK